MFQSYSFVRLSYFIKKTKKNNRKEAYSFYGHREKLEIKNIPALKVESKL